jgi:hypothetical protein
MFYEIQLPDASHCESESQHKMDVWRIGRTKDRTVLVAGKCPLCGGVHRHGWSPNSINTRVGHCPAVFKTSTTSHEYRLAFSEGPAPDWIATALTYPLGDLAACYALLDEPRKCVSAYPIRSSDRSEVIWVPDPKDVRFCLRTLGECGALDEALAFRTELGELPPVKATRGAVVDTWLRSHGPTMRLRLMDALRSCWLRHGGPA